MDGMKTVSVVVVLNAECLCMRSYRLSDDPSRSKPFSNYIIVVITRFIDQVFTRSVSSPSSLSDQPLFSKYV